MSRSWNLSGLLGLAGYCGFDLVQASQGSTFPIVEAATL